MARATSLALAAAAMLAASSCSSLDPNVGPVYIEPAGSDDAGIDSSTEPDGDDDVDPGGISFHLDIRPIIERPKDVMTGRGCKSCHYRTEPSHNGVDLGGLDMSTLGELRKGGGSSGKWIIVAGKPDQSVIVQALRGQYPYSARMPKGGPYWGADEMQRLVDWIAQGAKGAPDE